MRSADVITTQYRANQSFQRADGAPNDKLRIIPNGIDVAKFAAIPRDNAPRPPTVVMIGRIVPIKDIRTFIIAVGLLKDLVPNVLAVLIGPEDEDPDYAASCRQLVQQLGVELAIEFLGRVPDVLKYLALSDVLALSSISEAQPIAILEAAAIGLRDRVDRRRIVPGNHRGLRRGPHRRPRRHCRRTLQSEGDGRSARHHPAR